MLLVIQSGAGREQMESAANAGSYSGISEFDSIAQEPIVDAVTAENGHIYSLAAIQGCPDTGAGSGPWTCLVGEKRC